MGKFFLAFVCAAVLIPSEGRADLINYSYTGYVSSTFLPVQFPLNSTVTVSFTLDTSIVGMPVGPPNGNGYQYSLRYNGAVSNFQFGSISFGPSFDQNFVGVTDGFYNNIGYVDLFYVEVDQGGQGALVDLDGFSYTSNPPFLTSLNIPTSLDLSLATDATMVYYVGNSQVDLSFSPGPFPLPGSVPEPSTWAMMILGFCGLGFLAYSRKNGTLHIA